MRVEEYVDSFESLDELETDLSELTVQELCALLYDWEDFWARAKQIPPEHKWSSWGGLTGRGWGKMIDAETPIPTPNGWARLGDMHVGDELFDEAGRICHILEVFDGVPEKAYRLTFSDGTFIDACSEHQWVTWDHAARKSLCRSTTTFHQEFPTEWPSWVSKNGNRPKLRTTQEIVDTLTFGSRVDTNHCVPNALPLEIPDRILPVDPYTLGVWLGDGTSTNGSVTLHEDDRAIVDRIISAGYQLTRERKDPRSKAVLFCFDTRHACGDTSWTLGGKLKTLGVLQNKHIPQEYLRASSSQRLALLQGLFDSDGYSGGSHVEISFCTRTLAEGAVDLLRTMGQKPTMSAEPAKLYGKVCGTRYRIACKPTIQVFSLKRKAEKLHIFGAQGLRNRHRMVVNASPIPPVPMRCLTVDSPNSMFLCGEGMIPTHNTISMANFVTREVMSGRASRVALIAQNEDACIDVMIKGASGILEVSPPWFKARYELGRVVWPNGAQAFVYTPERPDAIFGPEHDLAWLSEIHGWPKSTMLKAFGNLRMGLRLGYARMIWDSNPRRKHPIIRMLLERGQLNPIKHVVFRGTTYENSANLNPEAVQEWKESYGDTSEGRAMLLGEQVDDEDGAIFKQTWIDAARRHSPPALKRRIIVIDPAISTRKATDPTGIVEMGTGTDGQIYVIADHTGRHTWEEWAALVLDKYQRGKCDCCVVERNRGGDACVAILRSHALQRGLQVVPVDNKATTSNIPGTIYVKEVLARNSKVSRGEPVASLCERGKISHVIGVDLTELEDQLTTYEDDSTGASPNNYDAFVWGVWELAGFWHDQRDTKAEVVAAAQVMKSFVVPKPYRRGL